MPSSPLLALTRAGLTLPGPQGSVPILKEITLEIYDEEQVSLTGKSGSGKTSLLMLAAGIERPTSGEVWLHGQALSKLGEGALARARRGAVSIVFQNFHLLPTLSAFENVVLPLEFAGRPQAEEAARAMLEQVGLGARLHHLPSQLSGGEQQRVAIARAFALKPRLLLADEPTGNLDEATATDVMALLFALQREHKTALLLVTHDAGLAQRCARRLTLHNGELRESPSQARPPQACRDA